MDNTSKHIVEYFYSQKPNECPLLFCFIEKDTEHKDSIAVQSAFTGEYDDGILFLSSLITNLGMIYKKDIVSVIRDIAEDIEKGGHAERKDLSISEEGKVSGEEPKPEAKKKHKLEVVNKDDDDPSDK